MGLKNPMQFWITTGLFSNGGEKKLGPFGSQDLAHQVREYYEQATNGEGKYWIDSEPDPPLTDKQIEAVWRAKWEAERAIRIVENDEDDIGPFRNAELPSESRGLTREQARRVTEAGLAAIRGNLDG